MPKIQLMSDVGSNIGLVLDAECLRCEVVEELNGEYTLEMDYPVDGEYFSEITYRKLIYCKPSPYANADYFRIYEIRPSMGGGRVTVLANHISYDLAGIVTAPFTATSAADAFAAMKNGAVTSCPFTFQTDVVTQATMTTKIPSNIRRLQGGVEGSIIDTFGGEYEYEGLTVKLLSRRGADRGSEIRYGKNLLSLEQEKNCASVYTAILPFWYTEEDGLVQGSLVQVTGTFDFVRVLSLDVTDKFDSKPTVSQVENAGRTYAVNNKVGIPKVSFTVDFVLLETTQEYADAISLADRVFLGDTVSVYFPKFGVNASARIIRTRYNVLTGSFIAVDIGEAKSLITDTITAQNNALTGIKDGVIRALPSAVAAAVQRATENITGAIKGYIHYVYDANGNPIELMILDNIDPANATKVWRWNMGGLGYSSTGVSGPFTTAITANGEIVADFITTGGMSASRITSGTIDAARITAANLTAGSIQSANGTSFVLNLNTGALSIDGSSGGGVNLKNCPLLITNSQTYLATNYSSSDTTRVQNILLGTVTPTSADYTKYDFYGDGVITTADLLLTQALANGSTNLTITWNCRIDTGKSQILRIWRQNSGSNTGSQEIFNASTAGVKMLDITTPTGLSSAPTDHQPLSYDFTVSSGFSAGGITFPTYAKGRYVATGTDAVMWAVASDGTCYTAFRNNGNWTNGRSFNHQKVSQSVSANSAMSFSLADGEVAMLSYTAGSAGDVDITLKVNGSDASQSSYSYAGTSNNYTSKIFARASSGTFVGFIAVHNGLVEVWGSGRRGTDNVRGDVYLAYSASSVTSLTFSAAGTVRITKL